MKNTALLFIGFLLFFNTRVYAQSESLANTILQKTFTIYEKLDSLSFRSTFLLQKLNTAGDWDTLHFQNNRYTAIQNKEKQWFLAPSLSHKQDNTADFYRFREALIRSKWAAQNHKIRLYKSCNATPYYVIQYFDVPFSLTASGDSLITQTIYIDTLTYLIKSVQNLASYQGQLMLSSFIIDSIDTHEKKNESAIFQLNRGMLEAGTLAPDFSLKNTKEQTVSLSDYKGKLLLLDFWYAACKPCIKAAVGLENLHQKYAKRGLVVLGMNTMDNASKINRHNRKHNISYESLLCSRDTKAKYKIRSYPSFYLIDRNGKIVFSSSGYYVGIEKDIELAILQAFSNR
jgi:peroxiredoxin